MYLDDLNESDDNEDILLFLEAEDEAYFEDVVRINKLDPTNPPDTLVNSINSTLLVIQ